MCGRYTLISQAVEIAEAFAVDVPSWEARYNIAPTQSVLAVRLGDTGRVCSLLRWGMVPRWAASLSGPPLINARSETVDHLPAFRSAFIKRRCLVPADGFFEWKAERKTKRPHHFTLKGGLFAFAGLWERWEGEQGVVESVAILTTEANDLVRPCHDRMPVILPAEARDLWLEPRADTTALRALLRPYPPSEMAVREVSRAVGSPGNEGPQCLAPAGPIQANLF